MFTQTEDFIIYSFITSLNNSLRDFQTSAATFYTSV